ncbi:hypothetical protein ATSB10_34790 [Dyella thiooxydans]|uniref:Uncharacterized protein n=1 Tax=Dyella thiooxydans TaxID=445710 RepID=A0A160N4G1_9GAMM|nr:hypothetical protein [Dyella thiooxydans]AND70933.1 hypothetical protein ATSB10_34790 [Dyella thiooxydans]
MTRALARAVPLALTLALHLAAWLVLTMPGAPGRQERPRSRRIDDALHLRWMTRDPATTSAPANVTRGLRHTSPPDAARRRHRRPRVTARQTAARGRMPTPAASTLITSLPAASVEPDYIPGGNRLQPATPPAVRLPGQAFVPGAPVFRMSDPRSQGMGGLVRAIAGLTGGADPKCLQLAQWRDLSRRERAALGITDEDMDRVEREHGCRPAASRGGPGSNPLLIPPGGR